MWGLGLRQGTVNRGVNRAPEAVVKVIPIPSFQECQVEQQHPHRISTSGKLQLHGKKQLLIGAIPPTPWVGACLGQTFLWIRTQTSQCVVHDCSHKAPWGRATRYYLLYNSSPAHDN